MAAKAIWVPHPHHAWTGPLTSLELLRLRPGPAGVRTGPPVMVSWKKPWPTRNHRLPSQAHAVRPLSALMVLSMPGYRSLSDPSLLMLKTPPDSLKMTRQLLVWRIAVIRSDGLPIRIGPLQEPATFGSAVHLRSTLRTWSAAQSSSPTTSRNMPPKLAGRTHAVQVEPLYSSTTPSSQATYRPSTGVA